MEIIYINNKKYVKNKILYIYNTKVPLSNIGSVVTYHIKAHDFVGSACSHHANYFLVHLYIHEWLSTSIGTCSVSLQHVTRAKKIFLFPTTPFFLIPRYRTCEWQSTLNFTLSDLIIGSNYNWTIFLFIFELTFI
jgi:hypothetical protein